MQRPWNKAHEVVYSLSTFSQNHIANMNICTYVVPVSMKPKKYMIALDPTTQTYTNFIKSEYAVLQILGEDCKKYVSTLWKKTGKDGDKLQKYAKELSSYKDFLVLSNVSVYIYVKKSQYIEVPDGDHHLFVVDVVSWRYAHPEKSFLTTESLF